MMNVLIAPDKFKGSLTAREVCDAVQQGLGNRHNITAVPLADGGEGTCELLTFFYEGKKIERVVSDPLFRKRKAEYGVSGDGTIAFIEMAAASGLQLLGPAERNPLITTTLGTGELIRDALEHDVTRVILGIGGSATNDAGIGMAHALGFEFYDAKGNLLSLTGENLIRLHTINEHNIHPRLRTVEFITLCDVNNPLSGPEGAAFVYGPQKGADEKTVHLLDEGLRNFASVAEKHFHINVDFPGSGAAGGMGAGTKVFLNASLCKGMEYIVSSTGLEEKIRKADLIITGEGKLDQQTLSGKVVMEIVRIASRFSKPVVIVCGSCELPADQLEKIGAPKVLTLIDSVTSVQEAIRHAPLLIKKRIASHFAI